MGAKEGKGAEMGERKGGKRIIKNRGGQRGVKAALRAALWTDRSMGLTAEARSRSSGSAAAGASDDTEQQRRGQQSIRKRENGRG